MNKKIFSIICFLFLSLPLLAQNYKPTLGARPNLPGDLYIHIGKNSLIGQPKEMNTKMWGSTSTQIAYMYPSQIGNTNFSINGGIGFSFENFAFKNDRTLAYMPDSLEVLRLTVARIDEAFGIQAVRRSKFMTTYVDVPLEVRWYSNKEKINKGGFYLALGGFVGYRLGGKNSISYTDDTGNKKLILKEDWGLSDFRAGASFRIGVAGFGAFVRYQLTPLFFEETAPFNTTAAPLTFGLTFDIF